jgi:hypothetical protein
MTNENPQKTTDSMGGRLLRLLCVLGCTVASFIPGASFAQSKVDSGYVSFDIPAGWDGQMSSDKKQIHVKPAGKSAAFIQVVMDNDLPRTLPELGAMLESAALKIIGQSFPPNALNIEEHCTAPEQVTLAKWNAAACSVFFNSDGYRAMMRIYGIPLGGETYLIAEFTSAYRGDVDSISQAHSLLEETLHLWTETATSNNRGGGSAAISVSGQGLSGTWRGSGFLTVIDSPLLSHSERVNVVLSFENGNNYSYAAVSGGWSSRHQGSFRLSQIPDVPNKYEYNMLLELDPSAGDDAQPHIYKMRFGPDGMELKPVEGTALHGNREQQQFALQRVE